MKRPRPEPLVARLAEDVALVVRRLPDALNQINTFAADGYPTSTSGSDPDAGPSTVYDEDGYPVSSTSVEAAVLQRQRARNDLEYLRRALEHSAANLAVVVGIVNRWQITEPFKAAQECVGGIGVDGWEDWGRRRNGVLLDACGEIADPRRGGYCTGCYYRRRRWHQRNEGD